MNPIIRKDLRRLLKRCAGRYLDAGLLHNVTDPNKVRIVALGNHLVDNVFLSQDTAGNLLVGFLDYQRSPPYLSLACISQMAFSTVAERRITTTGLVIMSLTVNIIDLPGKRTHRQ